MRTERDAYSRGNHHVGAAFRASDKREPVQRHFPRALGAPPRSRFLFDLSHVFDTPPRFPAGHWPVQGTERTEGSIAGGGSEDF
jgi:hypothetical protein